MIEKCIKSDRGNVFYWITEEWESERETLFFLHGLTGNHTMFEKQVAFFRREYNIIVWDAPRHGKSRTYEDFSFSKAVKDMKQILDENGVQRVVMLGQSLGGYFIQSFMQRYPGYVIAFVGIDTSPYGEGYYSALDKWILGQVEWMAKLYPFSIMKEAIARQSTETEVGRQNMREMLAVYDKEELCHLMGICYMEVLKENRNMKIECPVLLLLGEHDRIGKVKQYCRKWTQKTGYPLLIVKNAGHNSNVDNPDEVNQRIKYFLERYGY